MTIMREDLISAVGNCFSSLIKSLDPKKDPYISISTAIDELKNGPISYARFNQLLHFSSMAGISEGCFRYYFLDVPDCHPYPVEKVLLPEYKLEKGISEIRSLDQALWGLRRFMYDSMLYWGNFRQAYRDLRGLSYEQIRMLFCEKRTESQHMTTRGKVAGPIPIPIDNRYLISELACKTYETKELKNTSHVNLALEAFRLLRSEGIPVTPDALRGKTKTVAEGQQQQQLFELMFEEASTILTTEEEVIALYSGQWDAFQKARVHALDNTRIYLSLCNDLDVYVATSMRNRQDFRDMATVCKRIFESPLLSKYNIHYFDPTLSAAEHHEDKGIIECLMVKTAKVVLYFAQYKESFGKVSECAMALSLGKPVIILCPDDSKGHEVYTFYKDSHPLSRLVEFKTGIVNGAIITCKTEDVVNLLDRIFMDKMEFDLELKASTTAYYLLKERITGTTYRVVTDNKMLTEAFWNNWHDVP